MKVIILIYKDDILNLKGDNGALSIIKNNMKDAFFYTINENKLKDIDTNEDLYWILKNYIWKNKTFIIILKNNYKRIFILWAVKYI